MSSALKTAEPAVSLRGVGKTYRLYQRPAYRVLDLLGICPQDARYYTERAALAGIDLDVWPGEKVAIIGRNGAGKSTLLKIITETVSPTAGTARFRGRVSPLLQIGTGFHGDFTGRQNVYASLAHMGVTGDTAHARFDEIVAFAELEEYIDQPMKTYSTGMGARLMFATATSIEPEILVVDELLGVGDAYFAHKSFERMRQMCADAGTTLLLVTHDIYSALNLCERFVWIDRGAIVMEGDGRTIVAAYEQSIKEQEEQRLRLRNRVAMARPSTGNIVHVQVRSRSGFALPEPLALATIDLIGSGDERRTLGVAEGSPEWTLQPDSNLTAALIVDGVACRSLTPYGSIFHKAEWSVPIPSGSLSAVRVRWRYSGADQAEVVVLGQDKHVLARATLGPDTSWQDCTWPAGQPHAEQARPAASGHYGTGRLRIREVTFLDSDGRPTVKTRHGDRLDIDVIFELMDDPAPENPTFVVAFHRPGVAAGAYIHADHLLLPAGRLLAVQAHIPSVLLGSGTWLVTVGFAESDFYSMPFHPYFTVNDRWHHVIARGFELHVESSTSIDAAAFFLQPAVLDVRAVPAAEPVRSAASGS